MSAKELYVVVGVKGFQSYSTGVVARGLMNELAKLGWRVHEVGLAPSHQGKGLLRFVLETIYRYVVLPMHCRKVIPAGSMVYIVDHADSTVIRWLKECIVVVHLHDLTSLRPPWDFPFTATAKSIIIYVLSVLFKKPGIRRAHKIIAISNFTASEIKKYLSITVDRIQIVYNGVRQPLTTCDPVTQRSVFGLRRDARVIVSVGPASLRKNYLTIARALVNLDSKWVWLHVGAIDAHTRKYLATEGILNRVTVVRSVQEIGNVYCIGDVLVHASHYEGFGLPVLEAMLMKLPTISIDKQVSREVYRDFTTYFTSSEELSLILKNLQFRATDAMAAAEFASTYSWQRAGQLIDQVLQEIWLSKKALLDKDTSAVS